jgi:hypothetical protein
MSTQSSSRYEVPANKPSEGSEGTTGRMFCSLREAVPKVLPPDVHGARLEAINFFSNKWVSGTVLRYYFFDRDADFSEVRFTDGTTERRSWVGVEAQQQVVREAFQVWSALGIGVRFEEVASREEAEIRIGFMRGDGSWSALGRDILQEGPNARTMNFGWDLTRPGELDTAIHEIGHTLGLPHEHQNPKAGIEWDEEAVYAALAQPPNQWDRQKTFWNIIRKLPANEIEGTTWDPNSVMHYPFGVGLITKPEEYRNGIQPEGGISPKDKAWITTLYPPAPQGGEEQLKPAQSVLLNIAAGGQRHLAVKPQETRYYDFQTFGESDTVMVLFEDDSGTLRYVTADDDGGEATNAKFRIKLFKGRRYVLRLRLYYSDRPGETSVMMW